MNSFNKEEKWEVLAYLSRKCRESGGRKWEREREKRSVCSSTLEGAVAPFADICEKGHLEFAFVSDLTLLCLSFWN